MKIIAARINKKVGMIVMVAIFLSLCFMLANIFLTYDSTVRTVEISISYEDSSGYCS
ncbi:hypothetical protein [Brevibacillus nitrificans]|uniref:hypothetical protein n=1 Tax=Brevibacillus nitrificans TaxID=651560 RepID=UPI002859C0C7|nr:hypothetical protein [Brevibacillus nitrificans]MDR7318977.1 hypothetical protein [Brevibacillus nitrificans]